MLEFENVGYIFTDGVEIIRWKIPYFLHGSDQVNISFHSPWMGFYDQKCLLYAYPNGFDFNDTEGWVGVEFGPVRLPLDSTLTFSLVDSERREILSRETEKSDGSELCYKNLKWIRKKELKARSKEILNGSVLEVVCRVSVPGHKAEEAGSGGKGYLTKSGENSNSGCHTSNNEGVDELVRNFKDLFLESKDCDFLIQVKGREFRAHRFILKARIPAFHAMLTHTTKENKEGVLSIEDCDPGVFKEFLLFIYTGRVENLTPDTMCGLYALADKYNQLNLKKLCLNFMKNSLSIELICDVISLAITYEEAELLDLAALFFAKNTEQILQTEKWKIFIQENPLKVNELLIKSTKLDKGK